jgi:hypothetical protein
MPREEKSSLLSFSVILFSPLAESCTIGSKQLTLETEVVFSARGTSALGAGVLASVKGKAENGLRSLPRPDLTESCRKGKSGQS